MWFPFGGDVSEIVATYLVPVEVAIDVLVAWFRLGERPDSVIWKPC